MFLSAEDESYFLKLKDGRAFWEVGEEFDSQISGCLYLAPSQIMFSHDDIGPVFSNGKYSIKDTFLSLQRGHLDPGDLPPMKVVQHQGSYVSINNRRLAVFRLLEMYVKSDLRVPVEFVQKMDSFYSRYSTQCGGCYVHLRHSEFCIGRTQEETNFDPFSHKLTKPSHQSSWRDSDSDSDVNQSFYGGYDSDSDTS